ncbi:hypothetical protein HGM15179_022463, partial [Zosterops borbonicus]
VLQNILETERDYAKELQSLLGTYLRPLQSYDKLSAGDIMALLGNMEEISAFQQTLNQALEEVANDELEKFMEGQGAASPGILILTTSLSKPFLRLDKYVTLLQELERHMEVGGVWVYWAGSAP